MWTGSSASFPGVGTRLDQVAADLPDRIPIETKTVDEADHCRFLLVDHRGAVLPFIVAQELLVGQSDLAVSKALSLAPDDILRDAPALLL